MSTGIHETAIIHPGSNLGKNVSVGAYSIIEDNVEVGEDSWIGPHVVLRNHTRIGKANKIYQFCSIGEDPQHSGYKGELTSLVVGDGNIIREYCTLNRGTADHRGITQVGNNNLIMAYVHIAHDCIVGDHTIFANGASLAGHVEVGDYVVMGGFSLVHQFCHVGAHCITGIGAVCLQDIPPYIIAAGNTAKPYGINTKGLYRRDFKEHTIQKLKQAYRILYRSNLDLKTAIKKIEQLDPNIKELQLFSEFLHHAKRGIVRR